MQDRHWGLSNEEHPYRVLQLLSCRQSGELSSRCQRHQLTHFGSAVDMESDLKSHNINKKHDIWRTLYKSHNTFAKASTLRDALRKRSLRNNSRVFNDTAMEGLMGLVPSQPFRTSDSATVISWERVIVTTLSSSYKSIVSISNIKIEGVGSMSTSIELSKAEDGEECVTLSASTVLGYFQWRKAEVTASRKGIQLLWRQVRCWHHVRPSL